MNPPVHAASAAPVSPPAPAPAGRWIDAPWVGHASAVLSTFFGGMAVVVTRDLVATVPPIGLGSSRFLIGAAVIFAVVAILDRRALAVPKGERWKVLSLGLMFFMLFPLMFTLSLKYTEATRGGMMLATMPMWSAVISMVIGVERLGPRRMTGVAIAAVGVVVILSEKGLALSADGLLGDALMLATAFVGAVYGLATKAVLARTSVVALIAWGMLAGSSALLGVAIATGQTLELDALGAGGLARVAMLGVLGGAAAVYLWTYGLSRLSATQVAVYVNCNPVFATALAVAFLGETVSWRFAMGALVVFAGVALVNWARASRDAKPPPNPV